HRLGRVEGERATGCCRTWPPPPLSPETATESSILGCGFVLAFLCSEFAAALFCHS
ncbi:hypothetical protein S245_071039, partial [Arachis hypogaea]